MKEQEHFVFSCISIAKNRIFRLILKDDRSYATFLVEIGKLVEKGCEHEAFMPCKFTNETEYDSNLAKSTEFVRKINEYSRLEVISKLQKYNISYDIYLACLTEYTINNRKNSIVDILLRDLDFYVEKICLSNVKIVLRILSSYRNTDCMTVKDLFSEGVIGLRRAIELYNCELGIKFSTYASQWIKASINRAIADKDSLIRIPVNVREQSKEIDRIRRDLKVLLGRDATEEEIIDRMKKKISSLSNMDINFNYYQIDVNPREQNLDINGNSSVDASFEENLMDVNIIDETDSFTIRKLREVIRDYIYSVDSNKERYYLQYHFGLNDNNSVKSKEEIMDALDIQPCEYDRIRKRALSNIKKVMSRNKTALDAYSIASGWDSHSNLEH
ncbi:MAG: sigma-70 family RNA polymerase sigma factor [Ignavibacteria bacterium]|jgi:RNA polymerase primary sigma factor